MKHAWTAIVTIALLESEAAEFMRKGRLDMDYYKKEQSVDVGCFRCEQPLVEAWGTPCLAPVETSTSESSPGVSEDSMS
jgi:hypothetical protein